MNQKEIDLIETLFSKGVRVNEIGRRLKRSPSSISRVLSGERGALWRAHKIKNWRCPCCGGNIRTKICRVCDIRQKVESEKKTKSIPSWCDIINKNTKAVKENRERILSSERERKKTKRRIDPETGIGQF